MQNFSTEILKFTSSLGWNFEHLAIRMKKINLTKNDQQRNFHRSNNTCVNVKSRWNFQTTSTYPLWIYRIRNVKNYSITAVWIKIQKRASFFRRVKSQISRCSRHTGKAPKKERSIGITINRAISRVGSIIYRSHVLIPQDEWLKRNSVLFEEMTRYLRIFFSSWKASRSN